VESDAERAGRPDLRRRAGRRWRDWRWHLRNAARDSGRLEAWTGRALTAGDRAAARKFPVCVTPYYASLIRTGDSADPIGRLAIPSAAERGADGAETDPFGEAAHMPVPGLIRRYADRAVVLVTRACPVYCRHCTRKHSVGLRRSRIVEAAPNMGVIVRYLREHPEIREVLVSGGDPLMLSTGRLNRVLSALRALPSIEILRLGTRVPVTLPMRVDPPLARMLRRHHPLWINTHFNHPAELTPEAARACARLADAGIPLGNQTVLLRGVNDRIETLETLFRGLLRLRVRPYYLLQCDPVRGVSHFRVPLRRALGLVDELRARLTGLAVPAFVLDAAEGPGKVPLLPTGVERWERGAVWIRGPGGMRVRYPNPPEGPRRGERLASGSAGN
jgi:lysine 2,3-aminomutase